MARQRGDYLALAAGMEAGQKAAISQARALEDANKALATWLQGLTDLQLKQAMATAQAGKLREAIKDVSGMFDRSKAALMSWATAGLQGTTMGERLHFQTQLLRMEVSQLFLPAIQKVSEWIQKLTNWFRQLTGEQQNNLGKWLLSGAAFVGTLTLLPRLIAGIEGLRKGWAALSTVMLASPIIAIGAAVAILMAHTEQGRKSLAEMGETALEAFSTIGETLSTVLLPVLEFLASFFSGTIGKITVWAAVFVAAIFAVKSAFASLALTMLGATSILGLMAGAVALLALAFGKSEFTKFSENIAKQVRSGKKTLEQANEEIREKAEGEAFERREEDRRGKSPQALTRAFARGFGFDAGEQKRQEDIEEGLARNRRAAAESKRNQLLLSQTGQEDPRQTIQRIQTAALRAEDPNAKTAGEAEKIRIILERFFPYLTPKPDNQEKPPKGD